MSAAVLTGARELSGVDVPGGPPDPPAREAVLDATREHGAVRAVQLPLEGR